MRPGTKLRKSLGIRFWGHKKDTDRRADENPVRLFLEQ